MCEKKVHFTYSIKPCVSWFEYDDNYYIQHSFRAIKVLFENVQTNLKYAFNIKRGQTSYGIPYDYCSIMQVSYNILGAEFFYSI